MYKTNLYGVSELGQAEDGSNVRIPLPLVSDNGQFELTLVPQDNKGILKITNKFSNELYWNSKDYNPDMYNNPAAFLLSGNLGPDIELVLQDNGDIVIRSKTQDVKVFSNPCFTLSINSRFGTHMIWLNGDRQGPYSVKLTDKGILELKNKNNVVIWKSTYMWESLDTPFSVDLIPASDTASTYPYKFPDNYTFGLGNIGNSIIKDYYDKFYKGKDVPIDFSPFKIVSAVYLRNIGKANWLYDIGNLNGAMLVRDSSFFLFRTQLTFFETDPYLPLGDPGHMENVWDDNHLYCLVKNDSKYCKPLFTKNNDYKYISDGYGCRGSEEFTLAVPTTMDKDPYVALGAVVGQYKDVGPSILRVAGNNNFFSAAVHSDYLHKTNIDPRNTELWNIGFDGSSGCESDHTFWYTSPFLTWMVSSTNFENYQTASTHNKFYDILPYNVALSICTGDFSPTVGGEKVSLSNDFCNSIALTHCSADSGNLPRKQCVEYYKKLSKTEGSYDYDDEFIKFCVDQGKYRDPAYTKLCACFLPTQVYEDYINAIVDGLPEDQKEQVRSALTQPPPCNYPGCAIAAIDSIPRWNFKRGDECTNNAIQVCLSKTEIKNEGTLNGNVSTDTMINCLQKVTPGDIASLPPIGGGTTKKSSNTLWIVLAVIFVVLIILYFTVFKK